jgi:hypothetical protein
MVRIPQIWLFRLQSATLKLNVNVYFQQLTHASTFLIDRKVNVWVYLFDQLLNILETSRHAIFRCFVR